MLQSIRNLQNKHSHFSLRKTMENARKLFCYIYLFFIFTKYGYITRKFRIGHVRFLKGLHLNIIMLIK